MKARSLNKSGVILASVLWIIIILSLLAMSVARHSGMDASFMNYVIGHTRSYYAASAGVAYAMDLILEDSMDAKTQMADSLYQCGIKLGPGAGPKKLMMDIPVGNEESFDIEYSNTEDGTMLPGFEDEDRKINLNALTGSNEPLLSHLIVSLGFSRSDADVIAAAVVDWQDADESVTHQPDGAESEYYGRALLPYACKNRPLDHVDELKLMKGMRPEIFEKLQPYVTVYPKRPVRLTINFNTASPLVIKTVMGYAAQNIAGLDSASVNGLAEKIERFRNGPDGKAMTADDQELMTSGNTRDAMDLTSSEENLYRAVMQAYHNPVSNYFKVNVTGTEHRFSVTSRLEVVIQRNPLTIVAWHRDQ